MNDRDVEDILDRLERCSPDQRLRVFKTLREQFPIHTIEDMLGVPAEVILEAIHRSSDLSQRGIRGLIGEAEFGTSVAKRLDGWTTTPLVGDFRYDYEVKDARGLVRVQVKCQRREKGAALVDDDGMFVVETQKTRGGKKRGGKIADDLKTRPYRFGDFDILAVCMEASTKQWSAFMYTVERWLVPQTANRDCLYTYQYIPPSPNDDWTSDFLEAVAWFRSGDDKTIAGNAAPPKRPSKNSAPLRGKKKSAKPVQQNILDSILDD